MIFDLPSQNFSFAFKFFKTIIKYNRKDKFYDHHVAFECVAQAQLNTFLSIRQ